MSKIIFIQHKDESSNGPSSSKKPKVESPEKLPVHQAKRNSSRNRQSTSSVPLKISDLPTEILYKIIGNINIWHHNRIRATSKRMKDICDGFIMQQFRKAFTKQLRLNPCSYESATLITINQATEVYVRSGFESVFCGCILPMLRSCCYKDPFCFQAEQIKTFLFHFFTMIENVIGDPTSHKSRLMYNLTLIRLFKAFNTSTIKSSRSTRLRWRTVIELRGTWLGMVRTSRGQIQFQMCNQSHLLVMLSELLIASIAGDSFKRIWRCGDEIYKYGHDSSVNKRIPITIVTITVHGSKIVCSLFSKCFENDLSEFIWPPKWTNDKFTAKVGISWKEAFKEGCSKSFSPFF